MTRNTEPSMRNPVQPCSRKKRAPQTGFSACSTSGWRRIARVPVTASVENQTSITTPKAWPIRPVPWRWTMNRSTRMPTVIGTTAGSKAGILTPRPSMALRIEMTGVMTPSP
jgi:hypothetical protein